MSRISWRSTTGRSSISRTRSSSSGWGSSSSRSSPPTVRAPALEHRRLPVPESDVGVTLDVWLGRLGELESRADAERLIAAGHVLVDGEKQSKSHRLELGE